MSFELHDIVYTEDEPRISILVGQFGTTCVQAACTPTVNRHAMTARAKVLAPVGAKNVLASAPAVRNGENPQTPE